MSGAQYQPQSALDVFQKIWHGHPDAVRDKKCIFVSTGTSLFSIPVTTFVRPLYRVEDPGVTISSHATVPAPTDDVPRQGGWNGHDK